MQVPQTIFYCNIKQLLPGLKQITADNTWTHNRWGLLSSFLTGGAYYICLVFCFPNLKYIPLFLFKKTPLSHFKIHKCIRPSKHILCMLYGKILFSLGDHLAIYANIVLLLSNQVKENKFLEREEKKNHITLTLQQHFCWLA